jgi:hypothetical protein
MQQVGEPAVRSEKVADRISVDYFSAYKGVRNRLRKYKPTSVLSRALEVLWQPADSKFTEMQRAPWNVLLLVKWALLDRHASDKLGRDMPMQAFDAIRQELWSFPDRVDLLLKGTMPFRLFLRRMLFQQVEFQRRVTPGFVRQPALLGSLPADHPLRVLFRAKAGLEPLDFLDLALAAHGPILEGKAQMARAWFEPLLAAYGAEKINAFLRCISADYGELTAFVRGLPDADERKASEHFHFTPLKRLPFLRTQGVYRCWHPMVFLRSMEEFAHLIMSESGAEYVGRFSKVFERHVITEISKTREHFYDEVELRKLFGDTIEIPDAAIPMGSYNIIIESKAGLFDDSIMAIGNPEIFRHKTKALAKAVQQGWSASVAFRGRNAPQDLRGATEDYLFVVSNKPVNVGSGADLRSIYPEGELTYPNDDVKSLLPLEHIYFVSVDEFERLIASSSDVSALQAFLQKAVRLDASPATGKTFFDDHLRTFAGLRESNFLTSALEAAHGRVEQALKTRVS